MLRAPFEEIKTASEKYFETNLSASIPDASIKYSVNFMNQIHTLCEKISIETKGPHHVSILILKKELNPIQTILYLR